MKYAKYLAVIISVSAVLFLILGLFSSETSPVDSSHTGSVGFAQRDSDSLAVLSVISLLIFIFLFQSLLRNEDSFEPYSISFDYAYSEKALLSTVPFTVLFLLLSGGFAPASLGLLFAPVVYAAAKKMKVRVSETAVSVFLFIFLFFYMAVNISSIVTVNMPFMTSRSAYGLTEGAFGFASDALSFLCSLSASMIVIQSLTEEKNFEY